jgi:hypothetical protein
VVEPVFVEPVSHLETERVHAPLDASPPTVGAASAPRPVSSSSARGLTAGRSRPSSPVYWRVEGSLLELTTVRPIAFFTWNSQTYIARAVRRSLVLVMALLRPFLYLANRVAATLYCEA